VARVPRPGQAPDPLVDLDRFLVALEHPCDPPSSAAPGLSSSPSVAILQLSHQAAALASVARSAARDAQRCDVAQCSELAFLHLEMPPLSHRSVVPANAAQACELAAFELEKTAAWLGGDCYLPLRIWNRAQASLQRNTKLAALGLREFMSRVLHEQICGCVLSTQRGPDLSRFKALDNAPEDSPGMRHRMDTMDLVRSADIAIHAMERFTKVEAYETGLMGQFEKQHGYLLRSHLAMEQSGKQRDIASKWFQANRQFQYRHGRIFSPDSAEPSQVSDKLKKDV